MVRLLTVLMLAAGLAGCVVAPPGYYGYAPTPAYYGYAPGYYYGPSIDVGIGFGGGHGWHGR